MTRPRSSLAQLVRDQAAESVDLVLRRHVDATAEVMARELLNDQTFRAEMHTLLRDAFRAAMADLRRVRGAAVRIDGSARPSKRKRS